MMHLYTLKKVIKYGGLTVLILVVMDDALVPYEDDFDEDFGPS